jgi:soluble P-type ATPase
MLKLIIPGDTTLQLQYLILDFNGTLACDGALLEGVRPRLTTLAGHLDVHVLTGDTFGQARMAPAENQAEGKLRYIEQLGAHEAVCIGNGRNDRLALRAAALGIAVIQTEGAAVEALLAADIVLPSILPALDLLTHPLRLIATLRA